MPFHVVPSRAEQETLCPVPQSVSILSQQVSSLFVTEQDRRGETEMLLESGWSSPDAPRHTEVKTARWLPTLGAGNKCRGRGVDRNQST